MWEKELWADPVRVIFYLHQERKVIWTKFLPTIFFVNFTLYIFFSSKYDNEPEYDHIKYDNQSTKYDLEVRSTRMLVESTIMVSTKYDWFSPKYDFDFYSTIDCWKYDNVFDIRFAHRVGIMLAHIHRCKISTLQLPCHSKCNLCV